jgi:L-lactate dehydrogenase complex protein LldG
MVGAKTMTTDARTEVFARIASALADVRDPDPNPHHSVVGQASLAPSFAPTVAHSSLFDRFAAELAAVGGNAMLIANPMPSALSRAVADLVKASGGSAVVQRSELALAAASEIPQTNKIEADSAAVDEIERASVSLIQAESLIAETGSAIVFVTTYGARLLPYLPPSCIIVARASALRTRLDSGALGGEKDDRGERVIITGPSRTADIEKTIVLGAHGPGSLTVIVWETEETSTRT